MLTFTTALRTERARRNITQARAAQLLGVSQQSVAGWEQGRTRPKVDPRRLADFLHHEDGTCWTVAEVLDALEADRVGRGV